MKEQAADKIGDIKEAAAEKISDLKEAAADKINDLKEAASSKGGVLGNVKEFAANALDKGADVAKNLAAKLHS